MPAPTILSKPIRLKSNGNSFFWLKASNISEGDSVQIKKVSDSLLIYSGVVRRPHPNQLYWKVRVSRTRLRVTVADGDIVDVNITITNNGGTDSINGEVIVDDGPDNIVLTKRKTVATTNKKTSKAASKTIKKTPGTKAAKKKQTKKSTKKKSAKK